MRVSNALGSVTSSPALLTVIDPVITSQPVNHTNHAQTAVSFSVGIAGTTPAYQWSKDGTAIDQATNPTLTIPSVSAADAGGYSLMMSNQYGSVNSATATLSVVSPLSVQNITAGSGSVAITWSSIPGYTYTLQQNSDLSQTNWMDLEPAVMADAFSASVTNTATGSTQGFYRVHLGP